MSAASPVLPLDRTRESADRIWRLLGTPSVEIADLLAEIYQAALDADSERRALERAIEALTFGGTRDSA